MPISFQEHWENTRSIIFPNKSCFLYISTKSCATCAAESIVKWAAYWDVRSKDNSCHGKAHNKNVLIQDFEGVHGVISLISVFDIDVCLDWRSKQLAATESITPEHLIIMNHALGWRMMAWCNLLFFFFFILNCIQNSCQISLEALLVPPLCQRATISQGVAPHDTKFQELGVKVTQTSRISTTLCKWTWLGRVEKILSAAGNFYSLWC